MKILYYYIKTLLIEKKMVGELAVNDCKARFAASGLGIVWAFLQPLLTLLIFWYVFQVGFKSAPVANVEFIVWFAPAYLVWTFFSEALLQSTNCLLEYGYLIKKVNFKVSIIPPIKIISSSIIHLVFILFLVFLRIVYGYGISIYMVQSIYYFICTFLLLLGVGWFFSSLNVFAKDIYNIIAVTVQIGFWATPIFWNPETLTNEVAFILKLNPMYYVCTGYREAFVYDIWFWQHPLQTMYFWTFVIVMLLLGSNMFERLHLLFDDAL